MSRHCDGCGAEMGRGRQMDARLTMAVQPMQSSAWIEWDACSRGCLARVLVQQARELDPTLGGSVVATGKASPL